MHAVIILVNYSSKILNCTLNFKSLSSRFLNKQCSLQIIPVSNNSVTKCRSPHINPDIQHVVDCVRESAAKKFDNYAGMDCLSISFSCLVYMQGF